MNYLSQKKGFLGYDADQKKDHKVIVVPFGLEKTVSYGSGTKNGPSEIKYSLALPSNKYPAKPAKRIEIIAEPGRAKAKG